MLKQMVLFGILLSLALASLSGVFGQNEVIVREKPIRARSLTGRVQLGDSEDGVQGVLVEDCTRNWKVVKASRHTDANGRFDFANASRKATHYLRLSLNG